jgi:hypothetical protein
VPIANQTGFHATTAVKTRRPCSRIGSSLPFGQTSGQDSVLQRTTSIQVHVDAVATVVIYSLETIMSPPVHRVFREVLPYENRKQDLTPTKSPMNTKKLIVEGLTSKYQCHSDLTPTKLPAPNEVAPGGLVLRKTNEFMAQSLETVPGTFNLSFVLLTFLQVCAQHDTCCCQASTKL